MRKLSRHEVFAMTLGVTLIMSLVLKTPEAVQKQGLDCAITQVKSLREQGN